MIVLSNLTHTLLPCLGAILLLVGVKIKSTNYIIGALWICLIALLLQYQSAGGEILGSYFGYKNAAFYSFNLVVLITTILYLFFKLPLLQGKSTRYTTGFVSACLLVGSLLLLTNLWTNAFFIENRRAGTPIMQVATFTHLDYCKYRYVFYKVALDGRISYLCPNYYGIIPAIGQLDVSPEFLLNTLTRQATSSPRLDSHKP